MEKESSGILGCFFLLLNIKSFVINHYISIILYLLYNSREENCIGKLTESYIIIGVFLLEQIKCCHTRINSYFSNALARL